MEQTYTAIETLGGFLAFTDTAEGRRKLRQFLQQTADAISIRHSIPER